MIGTNLQAPNIRMRKLFYPKWWLQATNYYNNPGHFGPGVNLFAPNPTAPTADCLDCDFRLGKVMTLQATLFSLF